MNWGLCGWVVGGLGGLDSTTVVLNYYIDCLVINLMQDSSKKNKEEGREEKIDGGWVVDDGERVGPDDIERVNGNIDTVAIVSHPVRQGRAR